MATRERRTEEPTAPSPAPPAPAPSPSSRLRETIDRLVAAGEDAITRARSADSAAFLIAARQQGGE